jgi:phage nucleotide-binding protein
MAINLKSTSDVHSNGVKMLVYSQSGAGKTTLIKTLPSPIIISAESGLLSLEDCDIPYIEVNDMASLKEAYEYVTSDECSQFKSIALDSISEIAEVVLSAEKKKTKDGRTAYGEMDSQVTEIIRAFRDIPNKHVYFTAKLEKQQDEMGRVMYFPSLPGNKTAQKLPFFFDFVMALRIERDADGNTQRALMVESDGLWLAKQRGNKLNAWEGPDLGAIIAKIGGEV